MLAEAGTIMAKRVDANQAEIVKALRKVGASVQTLHMVGRGCPDLLVGFRRATYLLEVKIAKGTLTPEECRWHWCWNGNAVRTVRSVQDALWEIGAGRSQ